LKILDLLQITLKKWDGIDVLITANPKALESKPEGKISIKVNASYKKFQLTMK
jgi:hypothetical protein